MTKLLNYSWSESSTLLNGVELDGADAGDDIIQAKRREDMASDVMGADGDMQVSLGTNKSGEITFRLLQNSETNKFLRGLANAQDTGIFTELVFEYSNPTSNVTVAGTGGYFKQQSEVTRGLNANAQTWVLVFKTLVFA